MMSHKSTAQCKNCLPEKWWGNPKVHGFWDIDRDAGVAKCENCGYERKFVSRKIKIKSNGMTASQEKMIEVIREVVLQEDGHNSNYEYKQFEVKLCDWGSVSVLTEVGRIGDEETLLSILGRTRRHIFIGPKGSLKLANPAKWVDENGVIKKKPLNGYVKGRKALTCPSF